VPGRPSEPASTELRLRSLHDALPISIGTAAGTLDPAHAADPARVKVVVDARGRALYFSRAPIPFDRDGTASVRYHQHVGVYAYRSEEHTSELQSRGHLVCRLLLEKKK